MKNENKNENKKDDKNDKEEGKKDEREKAKEKEKNNGNSLKIKNKHHRHTWKEQKEFEEALNQCNSISKSKITLVTKFALTCPREYKMIVHLIEKSIRKEKKPVKCLNYMSLILFVAKHKKRKSKSSPNVLE